MTFQPVLPIGGLAGWAFLNRTQETQQDTLAQSTLMQRETTYFAENIANITSAEELVADRTLRKVALGAFGLQDDLPNIYFIQKLLEDGPTDSEALANRLSDKRYLQLAESFDFSNPLTLNTALPSFAEDIIARYERQTFEVAVGEQNTDFRLGLGFERELTTIIDRDLSEDAAWFTVLGTGPVREVFQGAFGLPDAFGASDLDQQLVTFRARAEALFGVSEVADFADPEKQEELLRLFLLRSAAANSFSALVPGATALALLQSRF